MPSAVPDAPEWWSISIPVTVAVLTTALVYARGWSRLRGASPNAPSVRTLTTFIGGILALWIAIGSPLATLDHIRLTFHMVQHLLLMTIAAPLILLAEPVMTLRHGLPERLVHCIVSPPLRRLRGLGNILTHPVCCWVAGTGVVIGWHIPAVFELGMRSQLWHAVQHASFLAGGLLFWWPVIQPWPAIAKWPRWSLPLYLFLATLPCDALSAFLAFCDRVVYSSHGAAQPADNALRLQDQELAGALMWCWVTFAYLIPAIGITLQILAPRPAPATTPPPTLIFRRRTVIERSS
jgi:cytochrome c oxidase assembly factor CtaG